MTPLIVIHLRRSIRKTIETALIGGLGATIFTLIGVPAGAILGAMLFTGAACLAGRRLGWPAPVRFLQLFLTGLGTGVAVTPAAAEAATHWPLSVALLLAISLLAWFASAQIFRKLCPSDPSTALFATAPGALSLTLALADEQKADLPKIAVSQTLRLTVLACFAPFLLGDTHPAPPLAEPIVPMLDGTAAWTALLSCAAAGCLLAKKLSWPLPAFLGALLGSGLMHVTGVVTLALPPSYMLPATAGIGALIGSRFTGLQLSALLRYMPASLAALAIMAVATIPAGYWLGPVMGVSPLAGVLAYAPGSTELMIAMSLTLGASPAFVTVHHLARVLVLLGALPGISAAIRASGRQTASKRASTKIKRQTVADGAAVLGQFSLRRRQRFVDAAVSR